MVGNSIVAGKQVHLKSIEIDQARPKRIKFVRFVV